MAVLTDEDRAALVKEMSSDLSNTRELCGVSKADLRAAVNAADAWADANAASFNSAIPQPARAALTAGQKARLLKYVITQRWIRS
jgi:hypothetical protein